MKYEYVTIKYNDNLPARLEIISAPGSLLGTALHWHKEPELIYIIGGSVIVSKGGDEFELNEGSIILINSGEIHRITAESDAVIKLFMLHLSYDFIKTFDSQIDLSSFVIAPKSKAEQAITDYTEELSEENISELRQYALIMNILQVLFEQCRRKRQISLYGDCRVNFRNAKIAMEYIEEHYREELSLNVMAELVGLSPVYFSKYFKDSTGMGFYSYVSTIRLKHALTDIMGRNMSVADAASYNGFPNVKSFENICKRSYGLTPLQFKKRQLMVS